MNHSFENLNLNSDILNSIKKLNILTPMDVQYEAIPKILKGEDVIVESYTGSGKTLAFLLPIMNNTDATKKEMQHLILAPTHELAVQIDSQIKLVSSELETPIKSEVIIGEVNLDRQIKKLREKPHIIVGTPGRILDLIKKKKITAHTLKSITVDEADNLIDSSNVTFIKDIIKCAMRDTQIMMFSASISDKTLNASKSLMKNPELIRLGNKMAINPNISHMYILVDKRDKFDTLRKLINAVEPERAMVFVNKGDEVEIATEKLNFHKKAALGIHGKTSKEDRKRALDSLRNGKINVLVSSDLSARGLDISGITHVFNLDFPRNANEYLHRAGRSARGNSSGCTISLASERETAAIRIYEREFNIKITPMKLFKGTLENM